MMNLLPCSQSDVSILAQFNRMLIEDENADNAMPLPQLEQRMERFLSSGRSAFFFEEDGSRVGYALVDTTLTPPYLRHFFICREHRRTGCGTRAFHALLERLQVRDIDIDVYVWNKRGVAFWKSLGFSERCYQMRYKG